jgi:hypothetical protein
MSQRRASLIPLEISLFLQVKNGGNRNMQMMYETEFLGKCENKSHVMYLIFELEPGIAQLV